MTGREAVVGDESWEFSFSLFKESAVKSLEFIMVKFSCEKSATMVFPVVITECEHWTIKKFWALKKWMVWVVELKTLESLGLQGDQTSPS